MISYCGSFAGDKEAAASIRRAVLMPLLDDPTAFATLDFAGVELATQSFIHALLAEVVRRNADVLDQIIFVNCSRNVRNLIEIVVDYAQEDFVVDDQAQASEPEVATNLLPIDLNAVNQDPLF